MILKSNRLRILVLFLCFITAKLQAQNGVAINTTGTSANSSAILDLHDYNATLINKGLLLPQVALATNVSSPGTGLMVYQTTAPAGIYYYTGSIWILLSSSTGSVTSFSSGNLSPLFTTSVTNPTTTPALSLTLSNANAASIFGNFTTAAAAPSYNAATADGQFLVRRSGGLSFGTILATDLPSLAGNYIQNQATTSQSANYYISGPASIGSANVSNQQLTVSTSTGSLGNAAIAGLNTTSTGYAIKGTNSAPVSTTQGAGGIIGITAQSGSGGVVGSNTNLNGTGIWGAGNNLTVVSTLSAGSGGAFYGTFTGAYGTFPSTTSTGSYLSPLSGFFGKSSYSGRGSYVSSYHFGLYGEKDEQDAGNFFADLRSGGVLGTLYRSDQSSINAWGSLGYLASNVGYYGGYFSGVTANTGGGGGFNRTANTTNQETGIGIGSYGGLMGGWIRGNIYGLNIKGKRYGMYVDGYTYINKPLVQLIDNGNNDRIVTYSVTSTTPDVYAHGKGKLINGHSTIQFDKNFTDAIDASQDIAITVTPLGQSNGVYLSNSNINSFDVEENSNPNSRTRSSVEFSWIAIGVRKGINKNEIANEVISKSFDNNMDKVMFDESDDTHSGSPVYWTGNSLSFNAPPKGLSQTFGRNLNVNTTKSVILENTNTQVQPSQNLQNNSKQLPSLKTNKTPKPLQKKTKQNKTNNQK